MHLLKKNLKTLKRKLLKRFPKRLKDSKESFDDLTKHI